MNAKYKLFDYVLVSGNKTGFGDIVGQIIEVDIKNYDEPMYNISFVISETPKGCDNGIFCAEKFLEQNEKTKYITNTLRSKKMKF